jgi:hypothetical protein
MSAGPQTKTRMHDFKSSQFAVGGRVQPGLSVATQQMPSRSPVTDAPWKAMMPAATTAS